MGYVKKCRGIALQSEALASRHIKCYILYKITERKL